MVSSLLFVGIVCVLEHLCRGSWIWGMFLDVNPACFFEILF